MNTEKLTIEQYAPYLPSELQVKDPLTIGPGVMVSICTGMIGLLLYEDTDNIEYYEPCELKPILKSLNDLTTEDLDFSEFATFIGLRSAVQNQTCLYKTMQYLIERHYDVFYLIKNGLAIDASSI